MPGAMAVALEVEPVVARLAELVAEVPVDQEASSTVAVVVAVAEAVVAVAVAVVVVEQVTVAQVTAGPATSACRAETQPARRPRPAARSPTVERQSYLA